jgi:hypothetical protein
MLTFVSVVVATATASLAVSVFHLIQTAYRTPLGMWILMSNLTVRDPLVNDIDFSSPLNFHPSSNLFAKLQTLYGPSGSTVT